MTTHQVPRLHSAALWKDQPLWDIALPLKIGEIHRRARLLVAAGNAGKTATPLLDLWVPAQSLNPIKGKEVSWERSEHRLLGLAAVFAQETELQRSLVCAETRLHVQARHVDERLVLTGNGFIASGTRLRLESGAVDLSVKHTSLVFELFRNLLPAGMQALGLRLLPEGLGLRVAQLPLWNGGAVVLRDVGVLLEGGADGALWLRLDPAAAPPADAATAETNRQAVEQQLALFADLLAASRDGPHWSALQRAVTLQSSQLRWPLQLSERRLSLLQPAGGVRIDLAAGALYAGLSDQPRDGALPPLTLARLDPVFISLHGEAAGTALELRSAPAQGPAQFRYAFDAARAEAPEALQALPGLVLHVVPGLGERMADIRSDTAPLRRVFLPLARGWLQLPLERLDPDEPGAAANENLASALSGEWQLGTRRSESLRDIRVMQMPWSLSLRGAGQFIARWHFVGGAGPWQLHSVQIDLHGTRAELRGLIWAALGQGDDEDLLPRLTLGTRHLRDLVLLQGARERCAGVVLRSALQITRRDDGWPELTPAPFRLDLAGPVAAAAVSWQSHPQLPAILAMPLSANRAAPQRPLASRELQPLPLRAAQLEFAQAKDQPWPALLPTAAVRPWWPSPDLPELPGGDFPAAAVWEGPPPAAGLPLLALSIAGAEFWPAADTQHYGIAYRCDLPALDEFHARARLPRQPPAAAAPVPDLATAEEAVICRHFLARHDAWCLSRGEGVELRDSAGTLARTRLLGGWTWSGGAIAIDTTARFAPLQLGRVDVSDAAFRWSASGDAALAGPRAGLRIDGDSVALQADGSDLVGWSIAAFERQGLHWDNRGIGCAAQAHGDWLRQRALHWRDEAHTVHEFALCTLAQPVALHIGRRRWNLWLRDLPFRGPRFVAAELPRSGAAGHVLPAYEWRLWPDEAAPAQWQLQPRELIDVVRDGERIDSLTLRAALDLPAGRDPGSLQAELVLKFRRNGDALLLDAVESGWLHLHLAGLAADGEAPALLQAELVCRDNDVYLAELRLELGLLGARRLLTHAGLLPLALPLRCEFAALAIATGNGDSAALQALALELGTTAAADGFSLELKLALAPLGELLLAQQWRGSDGGVMAASAVSLRHWRWLRDLADDEVALTPQLDLRSHSGFCATAAGVFDAGSVHLLPHWPVPQAQATLAFACTLGPGHVPVLHTAVIEAGVVGDQQELSLAQHSRYETAGWNHRLRVSGTWPLPSLLQWPAVQRNGNSIVLSADPATQHVELQFDGLEMAPRRLQVRSGQGLHLTLEQAAWLRATHRFRRGEVERRLQTLAPVWMGPLSALVQRLAEQGGYPALGMARGSHDNEFSPLVKAAGALLGEPVQQELAALAQQPALADALCVVALSTVSLAVDATAPASARPLALALFWADIDAAKLSATLKLMLRPQGQLNGALDFDELALAALAPLPQQRPALRAPPPAPASDPLPVWQASRAPLSALHGVVGALAPETQWLAVSQSGDRRFTHQGKTVTPALLRAVIEVDRLFAADGAARVCHTWLAQPGAAQQLEWWCADAGRDFAPAERGSVLAPAAAAHDLVLLGSLGMSGYADYGRAEAADVAAAARYLAAAAGDRVGVLAAAYRRRLTAVPVHYQACAVIPAVVNDFRAVAAPALAATAATRGWPMPPGDAQHGTRPAQAIALLLRQPWQDAAGFSGSRQHLRLARSAQRLPAAGPGWDVHEEKVTFAAPSAAAADALASAASWPAHERTASSSALRAAIARVLGPADGVQAVQPGWQEQHSVSARAGVMRCTAERRLQPGSSSGGANAWNAVPADVAASLLQQYRAPRPPPLPPNRGEQPEHDRRPRAGSAEPLRHRSLNFYTGAADLLRTRTPPGAVVVRLTHPAGAILPSQWDGTIGLAFDFRGSPVPPDFIGAFCRSVSAARLRFGAADLRLAGKPQALGQGMQIQATAEEYAQLRLPDVDEIDGELTLELRSDLGAAASSGTADDRAAPRVEPCTTLRFPLLRQSARRYPTPLRLCTALFEDAAYDAELGSEIGSASLQTLIGGERRSVVVIRTDRRSYSANGSLTALFTPDPQGNPPRQVTLSRLRLDAAQGGMLRVVLAAVRLDALAPAPAADGAPPRRWELAQLRDPKDGTPALAAGDVLAISLRFADAPGADAEIQLPITDEDPIAPPQSAYALWLMYARQPERGVRVPLAAWSPLPDRVELVQPERDLREGRVRRHAVFRWPLVLTQADLSAQPCAFVQKIDCTGASHTPDALDEFLPLQPLAEP